MIHELQRGATPPILATLDASEVEQSLYRRRDANADTLQPYVSMHYASCIGILIVLDYNCFFQSIENGNCMQTIHRNH